MPTRRGAFLPGLLLLLLGAWLLARNLGVPVPALDQLWPALPLVFGLGGLLQYFTGGRREDGLLFSGVAVVLTSAFFLAITLGALAWGDLGRLWPVFVLIGGVAFLAQWLARPSERGLLLPALLGLTVGGVALVFTLGLLNPAVTEQAARLWPLGLIVLGAGLLVSYLRYPNGRT
jgi:hypothetical protein